LRRRHCVTVTESAIIHEQPRGYCAGSVGLIADKAYDADLIVLILTPDRSLNTRPCENRTVVKIRLR
jgi:hypothetical protein